MIRSTRHHILDANFSKRKSYEKFLNEYSRVANLVVNKIWNELPEDLNIPRYFDYKTFNIPTDLSARVLSSIATQASGIVRASIEKQRRRFWVQKNRNPNVKNVKFSKPKLDFIAPELSSKCCDIQKTGGKFWGFIRLKSLGKNYGTFNLPIIKHPRIGTQPKSGVRFFKRSVQLVWEIDSLPTNGTVVVGADTGLKTVLTLSDGQKTPSKCPHGYSLETILEKISRKRKGSQSFQKAVDHRKNFVNWSINRLNFSNVKELRLEKVVNIRYGKQSSRKMSHWSNPEIRDKIKRRCEELEVPVVEQSSAYRSQRCHQCGQVRKSNRQGEIYCCENCGNVCNADWNAAKNHEIDLPKLPQLSGQKANLGNGFFWNPSGITFDGAESRVPLSATMK